MCSRIVCVRQATPICDVRLLFSTARRDERKVCITPVTYIFWNGRTNVILFVYLFFYIFTQTHTHTHFHMYV